MRILNNLLRLTLAALLTGCYHAGPQLRPEPRTTANGTPYTIFHPDKLAIRVVTSRPQSANEQYQLSVAAAYTDLATNQPLDLLVCNGRPLQPQAKVGFLDGVLTVLGDTLRITRIAKGQTPPAVVLEQARRRHGTVLLQELLVYQGQNQRATGGSLFQRRALVEFADQRFAVVENAAGQLTMQQFAADLIELGARNALYLDMGDWDEGWYRAGSRVVTLGQLRTETPRQSNWLVFVRLP